MPIAVPMIPDSASGVSTQRSGPNSSCRPLVARNTPPNRPTSSPRTTTRGSRRISKRRASLTAWMMFISGMRVTRLTPAVGGNQGGTSGQTSGRDGRDGRAKGPGKGPLNPRDEGRRAKPGGPHAGRRPGGPGVTSALLLGGRGRGHRRRRGRGCSRGLLGALGGGRGLGRNEVALRLLEDED